MTHALYRWAVLQGGRNAVNQFFEAFNEAFADWQPEALPQSLPSPKSPQGAPQRRALLFTMRTSRLL